jgi:hypothetical protein
MVELALGIVLGILMTLMFYRPSQQDIREAYQRSKKVAEEAHDALEQIKVVERRIVQRITSMTQEERDKILASIPDAV